MNKYIAIVLTLLVGIESVRLYQESRPFNEKLEIAMIQLSNSDFSKLQNSVKIILTKAILMKENN